MQTFLPYPDYDRSASVLDYRRLGKQRVETKQILLAIPKSKGAWVNHPATRMWRGYEMELCNYGLAMCRAWTAMGYRDGLAEFFVQTYREYAARGDLAVAPPWMGDERVHASHRSNLLRKEPVFYGQYGWSEPSFLPYFWPVS